MSPEGNDEHQQSGGEHDQERAYTQRPVWTSPTSEKGRGGSSVRKIHWEVKKYSKDGTGQRRPRLCYSLEGEGAQRAAIGID